jgi:hypothetical protein
MDAQCNLEGLFNFQQWASQRSSQLPGTVTNSGINASLLPESIAPSTTPNKTSQRHCPHQTKLAFMQEVEWDVDQTYDEEPLRYMIEWKVTLKGKAVSKDTEPDVALGPDCY